MRVLRLTVGLLLLFDGLAHARVGGGQHYSSPSHSSPSRSSGHAGSTSHASSWPSHTTGSGYASAPIVPYSRSSVSAFQLADPLLIFVFIILAIVMVVLLRRIFGASANTQRAFEERDAIGRLEVTAADREAWIAAWAPEAISTGSWPSATRAVSLSDSGRPLNCIIGANITRSVP